jgi:biopolymer transport protein ExbD
MRIPATIRHRSTDWVLQFINIVFLLLLYFLVNGTIAESQRPDIALPVSVERQAGQPPHDAVYVGRAGDISFRGASVSPEQLAEAVRGRTHTTVVADKALGARQLVKILDDLRQAGAGQMVLVTANQDPP